LSEYHKTDALITNELNQRAAPNDMPPAKKTKPDGKDEAAKLDRACPRPSGNLDQLLLIESYMSTYDDRFELSEADISA
jgi:hypothetical protein